MRQWLFIVFGFLLATTALGQEPSLSMSVDRNPVGLGERFKLTISLENAQGNIIPPDLDDFRIVGGPSVSNQMSSVNGQMSSSTSHS